MVKEDFLFKIVIVIAVLQDFQHKNQAFPADFPIFPADFPPRCSSHLNQPVAFLEVLAIGLSSSLGFEGTSSPKTSQNIWVNYHLFGYSNNKPPIFDGLYNPFLMIRGMVYHSNQH